MYKKLCINLLLFILLATTVQAKSESDSLDKVYLLDPFRIFYTVNAEHSLPVDNQKDQNKNSIPDYVENTALKLSAANILYTETFGLTNPLNNKRYQGKARFIDVHLLNIEGRGTAGDEVVRYRYQMLKDKSDRVLVIKLSNNLRAESKTPQHEMFHLFQNGYTMFKNRWYTEGTARWSDYAFKKGVGNDQPLPTSSEALSALVKQDYGASVFWNRLTYLCDRNAGQFALPKLPQQQITSYPTPFEDNTVHGYGFIKSLLENLQYQSDKVSKERGYTAYNWDEDDQKYNANNHVPIFCAIKQAITKTCGAEQLKTAEMSRFLSALELYTQKRCD